MQCATSTPASSRVVLPAGVSGRIGIPKVERRHHPHHRQRPLPGMAVSTPWRHRRRSEDADFVTFSGVARGARHLRLPRHLPGQHPRRGRNGSRFSHPLPGRGPPHPGNWGGVHGRDGYVLPDYDGVGKDVRKLPPYVRSVTLNRCRRLCLGCRG